MKKTITTLAAAVVLAVGTIAAQAQWSYIDVQDGTLYPPGNTYDVIFNDTINWALGVDGNSTFGWRTRSVTGPGAPAFNQTAYSGFYLNQFGGQPDPELYMPVTLAPSTVYNVRVYASFANNVTNVNLGSRSRLGAEISLDGGATWQLADTRGGGTVQVVDNSSGVGVDLAAPLTGGDFRGYILLSSTLTTDGAGNGQVNIRLPQLLTDGSNQDRFHLDGFAFAVPEPTTLALAGLGAAALLIFRRRQ